MQQAPRDTLVKKLLPANTKTSSGIFTNGQPKSFSDLRTSIDYVRKINDLDPEQQNLFNFLKLIVDIKYRHKYGHKIEQDSGEGYSTYDD